jgi:hypothetical protein
MVEFADTCPAQQKYWPKFMVDRNNHILLPPASLICRSVIRAI